VIAVVLALTGFINLLTGLAHVFAAAYLPMERIPDYLRLSSAGGISGIITILLGVLLVALARGLFERRRRSWYWTVLVITALIINNLIRRSTPQTSILSGSLLILLLAYRKRFNVPSDKKFVYAQIFAMVTISFALAYGIVGSYLLRNQFEGIETVTDAVYYTFVTYSTLGYGDVLPSTADAKLFVTSMIIIGIGTFITALTMLVGPTVEARMKGVLRIMSRFQHISHHVLICGYSNVSESVIDQLQDLRVPYIVIDDRKDITLALQQKGHDVLAGDPTDMDILQQGNLKEAKAIIAAFDSDSVNAMITLTAREYRNKTEGASFQIVVRVEDEGNIEKVRHAGADEVISPSTMGGRLMAKRAAGSI
jgi:voltage-gated potassium channel